MSETIREKPGDQAGFVIGNQTYALRPAYPQEVGLFYSLPAEEDTELGTVGWIRMDFGRSGEGFWHSWWPKNHDFLNSEEFEAELTEVVEGLRTSGPLQSLDAMRRYCEKHGSALGHDARQQYGYVLETPNYRYCLRCIPWPNDYNAYLNIYDLRVQRQNLIQKGVVGRVSFANGEEIAYTDADDYIKAINEEIPYQNTSGFRFETLTDDPAVRKAVDDTLYDLYGEENPRELEDYQQAPGEGLAFSDGQTM